MAAVRSSSPLTLKLLPKLANAAPQSAVSFGLPFSMLVAILVRNDALRPNRALEALPREGKLVRQSLPCSLRAAHHRMARRRAREQGMSMNAYLEALVDAHLAQPIGELIIYSSKK